MTPPADFARSPLSRALWLATVAMLVASSVVLITGFAAGDDSAARDRQGEGSAAEVADGAAGPGAGAPGDPATTGAGAAPGPPAPGAPGTGAGTPSQSGSPAPLGASAAPRLNGEPTPGTYRYKVTTKSGDEPAKRSDGTTRVEPISAGDGGTRQNVTAESSNGSTRMQTLWQGGTVHVVEQSFTFAGNDATCRWDPALLLRQAPLSPGASWRGESSCQMSIGANSFKAHIVEDAKVVKAETRKVGGRDVRVLVIERTSTQSGDGTGYQATTRTTERFAPDIGLIVTSHAEVSYKTFGGSGTFVTDQELLDTKPS